MFVTMFVTMLGLVQTAGVGGMLVVASGDGVRRFLPPESAGADTGGYSEGQPPAVLQMGVVGTAGRSWDTGFDYVL